MLNDANVQPMLPVRDLQNARRFYHDVLGLEEVGEEPGEAVVYRTGDTTLCVYTVPTPVLLASVSRPSALTTGRSGLMARL